MSDDCSSTLSEESLTHSFSSLNASHLILTLDQVKQTMTRRIFKASDTIFMKSIISKSIIVPIISTVLYKSSRINVFTGSTLQLCEASVAYTISYCR